MEPSGLEEVESMLVAQFKASQNLQEVTRTAKKMTIGVVEREFGSDNPLSYPRNIWGQCNND
jgi:hypothetical protein